MDKEEAMKILKDFHDKSALFSVRTALDTIIPELKVSEDEEVRKIILDQMKCWNEDAIQKNCEIDIEASSKCIAWLEKQGNQREQLINKACDVLVNCIEDYMLRRMEVWNEEDKKQTLENIRKKLEE